MTRPLVDRVCVECGAGFVGTHRRNCCSPACQQARNAAPRERSPRLPVAPLVAEFIDERELALSLGWDTLHEFAHETNWYRWKSDGLTWPAADTLACALGRHPGLVWGAEWWAAMAWHDEHRPLETTGRYRWRRDPRWGLIAAEIGAVA